MNYFNSSYKLLKMTSFVFNKKMYKFKLFKITNITIVNMVAYI